MLKFTLDTNCVIAVDENRIEGTYVQELAHAASEGAADVAVVAIMASEKQKHGGYLHSFFEFEQRMRFLGLGYLKLALPLAYFDICYWGKCLWAGNDDIKLDRKIQEALFANIEYDFDDFCKGRGLDPKSCDAKQYQIWRNAKCDVQAIWSHVHIGGEIFVTSDRNFHRLSKHILAELGAGQIAKPQDAVLMLS